MLYCQLATCSLSGCWQPSSYYPYQVRVTQTSHHIGVFFKTHHPLSFFDVLRKASFSDEEDQCVEPYHNG